MTNDMFKAAEMPASDARIAVVKKKEEVDRC